MSLVQILCLYYVVVLATSDDPQPAIYVNSTSGINDTACWSGGPSTPCLTLELGLRGIHNNRQGTLLIAPGRYRLNTSSVTEFNGMNNVSLRGVTDHSVKPPVVVSCDTDVGLAFVKMDSLTISGITFSGCGGLRNSTSYVSSTLNDNVPAFMQFYVGVYFLYCSDLNITLVEVLDTPGTGMVIYNTIGTNLIHNCTFTNNVFQPYTNYSGGGGLHVEFSYCDVTTIDCLINNISNIEPGFNEDSTYRISNCYFLKNRANVIEAEANTDSFILPIGRNHVSLGRGGGLSFYIIGSATRNKITIEDSLFVRNHAIWGAGLLVEFHDSAHENTFQVVGSTFTENDLKYDLNHNRGTGGGGARLAMFAFPQGNNAVIENNNVTFHNCTFEKNSAYYGGGFSFYTNKVCLSNSLTLSLCTFFSNLARLGAGLDVAQFHISIDGDNPEIIISDCNFQLNKAFYENLRGTLVGIGAIYIDSIPVVFNGDILLNNNHGSALTITDARVTLLNNCSMKFSNNKGRFGGGMSITGNGYIVASPNVSFDFVKNSADFFGGAIYYHSSGERDLVGSGNCFIRYSDVVLPREQWKASFYFEGNSANGNANAIYASTVLPCVHSGEDWNTDIGTNRVFCWNDLWVYDNGTGPVSCQSQIETAANTYNISQNYNVTPGKMFSLEASAKNDYGNPVTGPTTYLLRIKTTDSNASFECNKSVTYETISHGYILMYGQPNTTVPVQIETTDPIVIQNTFYVHFQECPPGFHMPARVGPLGCVCAGSFGGFLTCDQNTFTSTTLHSNWVGKIKDHDELVNGGSPYISQISDQNQVTLPQSIEELNDFFCNQSHSTGTLCGKCLGGYGVSVAAFEYIHTPCIKCSKESVYYNWIYYILACFVPIIVFFLFIFVFSVSVTGGPLNSFIFFAQVINSVTKTNADGLIPLPNDGGFQFIHIFYGAVYSIWNLKFLDPWLHFCLSPHLNSLDMLLIGYLRALFPLLLLVIAVLMLYFYDKGIHCVVFCCRPFHRCVARFRQFSNVNESMIGGFAVFIIISYTQVTLISVLVLTPAALYDAHENIIKRVFYYDGNITYSFKSYYVIPPIIFMALFVLIPPIFFGYPSLLKLISFLTRRKATFERLYPSPKVQALLNEFHGCYKDGSDGKMDCRWFSSLYFVLRIALVLAYAFTSTWQLQYTVQIMFFVFVAFLFAMFRPYRKDWINIVDIAVFLLLAGICTISQYNLTNTRIGNEVDKNAMVIQQLLIGLPLVYCIGYCCQLLWYNAVPCLKRIKHRPKPKTVDALEPQSMINETSDNETHHRYSMEDSTHVPNFLEFIETSGRSSTTPPIESCSQIPVPIVTTNSSINSSINESTPLTGSEGRGYVPWYRRRWSKPRTSRKLPYGATH